LVRPTNTANVHIQLRWCTAQTRRRRAPNTATAHFRLGCCAEQSQNIIDIFRNSTDISTNSIEIFGNINDILSLEGGINGIDANNGWVRSANAPCFHCVAADFPLRHEGNDAASWLTGGAVGQDVASEWMNYAPGTGGYNNAYLPKKEQILISFLQKSFTFAERAVCA